jgi:hypothetical protein
MRKSLIIAGVLIVVLAVVALPSRTRAYHRHRDFGSFVESQLAAHSEQLFGINRPLEESALGPYDGPDNLQAIEVAPSLHVTWRLTAGSKNIEERRGGGQPQKTRWPRRSSALATAISAASASLRVLNGPIPFIRS